MSKANKFETYVITLSSVFPVKHPNAGKPTFFKTKLENANVIPFDESNRQSVPDGQPQMKLHTIRGNYPLWRKRFDKIERGEACISLRQWTGKPYKSKQIEIGRLTKDDGIGIQKMEFLAFQEGYRKDAGIWIAGHVIPMHLREQIARNDGLTLKDWDDWFADYDKTEPFAIIHFTKFRY